MGRNGAAPGRRLAATALPHLLPVLPVRAPSTSTSALCYRLLGIIGNYKPSEVNLPLNFPDYHASFRLFP
jgi:hypothetical protein